MRLQFTGVAVALLAMAGCSTLPPQAPAARATIFDASGRPVARAAVGQSAGGLAVRVEATGLAVGTYGVHVHSIGRCDGPAFASAGGHWNPTARQHGRDNPAGAHLGDLPNLVVGADGHGAVDFAIAGGSLTAGANALLDVDGAAIVIHAQPDDYRTDPSGNSGVRMACGILAAG